MMIDIYILFQTTLKLMVRQLLSNDNTQSEYSDGYRFKETVNKFGLKSKLVSIIIKLCILVPLKPKILYVSVLLLVSFQ